MQDEEDEVVRLVREMQRLQAASDTLEGQAYEECLDQFTEVSDQLLAVLQARLAVRDE